MSKLNSLKIKCVLFVLFLLLPLILIGFSTLILAPKTNDFQINVPNEVSIKNDEIEYILEWNTTWGYSGEDYGYDITIGSDGKIYITGIFDNISTGNDDAFFAVYNWEGSQLLNVSYDYNNNDEYGNGITVDDSGNVYIAGLCSDGSLSGTTADAFIKKFDPTGYTESSLGWEYFFGSVGYDDTANDVKLDSSNNIIVVGKKGSASDEDELILYKFNADLNETVWIQNFTGPEDEEGKAVVIGDYDDIYVSGMTSSYEPAFGDALIVKYNSTGIQQWNQTWGEGTNLDPGEDIALVGCKCYITGYTGWYYGETYYDIYLTEMSGASGITTEVETWKGPIVDYGYGLAVDKNDNIFIVGETMFPGTGYDAVLVKYNSMMDYQWNLSWNGLSTDGYQAIALDNNGNIYIVGYTYSYGAGYTDILLVKYGIDLDADGLTYDQEVYKYYTNPYDSDHDNDGIDDGAEVNNGTNPLDPNDYPGMTTSTEIPGFEFHLILITLLGIVGLPIIFMRSRKSNVM